MIVFGLRSGQDGSGQAIQFIGSLFWEVKADAIVLLNKSVHAEYVKQREDLDWTRVEEIVQVLADMAQEKAIPVYDTIHAAVPKPHMKQFVMDKF